MSSVATPTPIPPRPWWQVPDVVLDFARWATDKYGLSAHDALDLIGEPWKWQDEYELFEGRS